MNRKKTVKTKVLNTHTHTHTRNKWTTIFQFEYVKPIIIEDCIQSDSIGVLRHTLPNLMFSIFISNYYIWILVTIGSGELNFNLDVTQNSLTGRQPQMITNIDTLVLGCIVSSHYDRFHSQLTLFRFLPSSLVALESRGGKNI